MPVFHMSDENEGVSLYSRGINIKLDESIAEDQRRPPLKKNAMRIKCLGIANIPETQPCIDIVNFDWQARHVFQNIYETKNKLFKVQFSKKVNINREVLVNPYPFWKIIIWKNAKYQLRVI